MRHFIVIVGCVLGIAGCAQQPLGQDPDDSDAGAPPSPATPAVDRASAQAFAFDAALDGGAPDGAPDAGEALSDAGPDADQPPDPSCGYPREAAVAQLLDEARADEGLPELTCDPALRLAAAAHNDDACNWGVLEFEGPDGETPLERIRAAGLDAEIYGAAILQGSDDPEEVFQVWAEQPYFGATFLTTRVARVGTHWARCGGSHYWTVFVTD